MTTPAGRTPLDHLTSDELDQLYNDLDRYEEVVGEMNERAIGLARQAARAESAVARVRALHRRNENTGDCEHCSADAYPYYSVRHPCPTIRALEAAEPGPAATQATDADTRVIALYERWVKAGPPPLGVSLSRWWDTRLIELHNAIRPAADEPARTTPNNPTTSKDAP